MATRAGIEMTLLIIDIASDPIEVRIDTLRAPASRPFDTATE